MHFIDQIDFEAATRRGVLHVVEQIAGIFNFGTRCGVNLNQIDKAALLNFTAVITLTTGGGSDTGFAVKAFGQQTRNSGFPYSAGAGEEISMMDASQRQSIRQRRQNMFLTDNISKSLGTPFSRKYLIAHVEFDEVGWKDERRRSATPV
jgi:hypothetical protein